MGLRAGLATRAEWALCFSLAGILVALVGIGGGGLRVGLAVIVAVLLVAAWRRPASVSMGDSRLARLAGLVVERSSPRVVAGALVLVCAVPWLAIYGLKHASFELNNFDAGIYGNIVFNTARGDLFYSSVLDKNHLGEHFSPIMAVFVPFYWLRPDVRWLLGAQVLAYALVPFLLYAISGQYSRIPSRRIAVTLILSVAWSVYRPIIAAMDYPFHPSTLAMPVVLLAFLFLEARRYGAMLLCLGGLLLFKENLPLVWVGFGMYLIAAHEQRWLGMLLILLGATAMALMMGFVIPSFSESSYGKLGRLGPLVDPLDKMRYCLGLLWPLAFLPLLYWRRGVIALPLGALNLASGYGAMYSTKFHYDDLIAACLFCVLPAILLVDIAPWLARVPRQGRVALLAVWFTLLFLSAAASPLRASFELRSHEHALMHAELRELVRRFPQEPIHLQNSVGTYINHPTARAFRPGKRDCGQDVLPEGGMIVLAPGTSTWGIQGYSACLEALDAGGHAVLVDGFRELRVYRLP